MPHTDGLAFQADQSKSAQHFNFNKILALIF